MPLAIFLSPFSFFSFSFLVFASFLSFDPGASFILCSWGGGVTVFCVLAIHARIHLSPSGHGRGFGVWRNAYAFLYTGLDPLLEVDFVLVFVFDFFSFLLMYRTSPYLLLVKMG